MAGGARATEPGPVVVETPATLGHLRVVCAAVVAACHQHSPAARALAADLELAVQEVAANVVRHAYRDEPGGRLRVEVTFDPAGVGVLLVDDGLPFDPTATPPPAAEPRVHGYGLGLVRRLVDEVEYRRAGDRNHWRLGCRFPQGG